MNKMTSACLLAITAAACLSACGSSGSSGTTLTLQQQIIQAKQYVVSPNAYKFDNINYAGGKAVDLSDTSKYPIGQFSDITNVQVGASTNTGTMKIYQQAYSVVITSNLADEGFKVRDYIGLKTKPTYIPISSSATYTGAAVSSGSQSLTGLSYTVNFGTQTGSGTINGLVGTHGIITLNSGSISSGKITGGANSISLGAGNYELHFFGPNAEEIAGKVTGLGANNDVGFAGKR